MRETTIARNYAEALFVVGEKHGLTEKFADLIEGVAGAIEADVRIRIAMESPRVPKRTKQDVLRKALSGRAPDEFIRFLAAVVKRGRQGIIPLISAEYLRLVDEKFNRIHAGVTLAREADESLQHEIRDKLSDVLGKKVIPHYRVDDEILGGLVVRVNGRTMDGSLRRKLKTLRRKLLSA
ncbi:MAG: ATP synthase F1 subunit delta [Gemmatimonadales bacterium]